MLNMKVADYVINYLSEIGVTDVLLVYGAANGDLVDAFTRNDNIRYVSVMHEQAGGFAAEGFAKVKKNIGVAMATSGPGGMNFVTAIGNCFYDSVPCLFITGQIDSKFRRPHDGIRQIGFQETDIVSIVSPITKYAKIVTSAQHIKYEMEKAIYIAKSGRPGPVLLDLPLDIQRKDVDPSLMTGFIPIEISYDTANFRSSISSLISDLVQAKRPVILVGGGVKLSNAEEDVRKLISTLKIPAFPTWNALDVVTSDFAYYGGRIGTYGGAGRNFGIQNSDLLLAIGSRISGRITGGNVRSFCRGAKKYVVDIDAHMLEPNYQQVPFDECIYSDAKFFINALIKEMPSILPDYSVWLSKVLQWKDKYNPVTDDCFQKTQPTNPYAFMRILSDLATKDAIIIPDCGGNLVISNHAFEIKWGQKYFSSNGNSPMGYSFAAAIGAWLASDKKQPVIAVIGDGGFNMNIQELQTLITYGINVKTVILNNHIYGITKAFQETNFNGRAEACGPKGYVAPDFVKICQAYGVKCLSININDTVEITNIIQQMLDYSGPVVCDVNCHEWHTYEPKIVGWDTPIEDMYPYLSEDEFLSNMIIEPLDTYKNRFYPLVVNKPNK